VVPDAKKLAELSYDEMQELAAAGAKVLNAQAVEFAKQKGIVILAKSTFGSGTGSAVRETAAADRRVKGVAAEGDLAVLTAGGESQALPELLDFLDARGVRGRFLSFDGVGAGGTTFVAVPLQDVHGLTALQKDLTDRFGGRVRLREGLGTVTCVGTGLNADWTHLRRALAAAEALRAPVHGVHTSALQLTLLVEKTHLPELTRRLHADFVTAISRD
jgi:aspartate kinase